MNKKPENVTQFFNAKTIGRNLREVAVDLVKTENDDFISRWFHSESTDLYAWVDKHQNIIKQQISFHGQVVEWNCLEGLKTGFVVEDDMTFTEADQPRADSPEPSKSAETIHFDKNPLVNSVDLALEIVTHMDGENSFLTQLIGNFKDPQYLMTMSPKEFMERFGVNLRNAGRVDQGLWESVKRNLERIFKRS